VARCAWAPSRPLYGPYHDTEWGLLSDTGFVRHRGRIAATVHNARQAQLLRDEEGSLAACFWRWEPPRRDGALDTASLRKLGQTAESAALARDLKKRGWAFVGPTTVHAFMQAMGLVNDHAAGCARHERVEARLTDFRRPRPVPSGAVPARR
jgi:DNA-3-methyladenine glycosylase I